jgi:hypothetical protein
MSPIGLVPRHTTDESPKYTGEFSGSLLIASDGELNSGNPFKGQAQPIAQFSLRAFNFSLPIPLACDIILSVTKLGEFFKFTPIGPGVVGVTYPTTIANSDETISTSIDYNQYQFLTAQATPTYPYYFEGWYDSDDNSSGLLIQTGSTLTIYEENSTVYDHYYAHFSTEVANRVEYFISTRYTDGTSDGTAYPGAYGNADSVEQLYPATVPATGSMTITQNWSAYSQFIVNAIDDYGGNAYTFQGWYDSSNNLLSTDNQLSITEGAFDDVRQFYALYD